MPTILQLPQTGTVTPADLVPLSQFGTTCATSMGDLLASAQPAIMAPTGALLGRNSIGAGGPEPVVVGSGLGLNAGTLAALGITGLATTTTIAAADLVGISQGGADRTITYAAFLDGITIDVAQPAAPAGDTDTLWVAQGTSTMLRQTFAAVWGWVAGKLPSYKRPVVELSSSTTLDGTVHNGRILVCSAPLTLSPAFINMGSGFACDVINLSGGVVTFATGIITSTGTGQLAAGQSAQLRAVTYSGGNAVFAAISGASGALPAVPGQITGLAASGASTSSISLSWSAPASGGTPASYTVQYRMSGTTAWTTSSGSIIGTSDTVGSLTAGTTYDFQVFATNAGGAGVPSAIVTASTAAPAGMVSSITWNVFPSGSYAPASGTIAVNAHVSPSTATVQFGFATSATVPPSVWTAGAFVNTDLWGAYVAVPATAGTWYAWCEGTDGSAPTVYATPFTVT